MTPDQMAAFKQAHRIAGRQRVGAASPASTSSPRSSRRSARRCRSPGGPRRHGAARGAGAGAASRSGRRAARASTQEAFGRIMGELARDEGELAARIVTTSPDVTVSTNLGAWVGAAQRVQPRRARRRLQGAEGRLEPALGREPARPARRARHRREQPVPDAGGARPRRAAVRPAPAAGRHALRSVHRPRPRCADLRELPGRALSAGRDAVRASRWRPRAARTSRSRPT